MTKNLFILLVASKKPIIKKLFAMVQNTILFKHQVTFIISNQNRTGYQTGKSMGSGFEGPTGVEPGSNRF
ncbi:hypothetical protein MTR_7g034360 [Medicago truncatula]|uniref:Uncharacterized protein n=1 Tax=Medicago truncatula TaxID=3880 RepID=A0A072TXI2_MEDTR|nr:hypothetical protein MTR_7g034360 [Medicago truncatula]